MVREEAERLALKALAWVAGDERLLLTFLDVSGIAPADLAARADEGEVQGAVLDFVLSNEAWAREFAETEGLEAARLSAARGVLPGGGEVHWT